MSKYKFFTKHSIEGMGWFRLMGVGVAWKNYKQHGLSFAERYGYGFHIKIGNYIFHFLKP